jgi:nicotinamidase-related amidase
MTSNQSPGMQPASMDIDPHVIGDLDPARTALVLVHMVKGWLGTSTPPSTSFPAPGRGERDHWGSGTAARRVPRCQGEGALHRGELQARASRGQADLSAVARSVRLCLPDGGHSAVEVIDDVAPPPDEPVVRGQAANGFDRTELDTILRLAGVDNLVLGGIATDVAVESTVRAASDPGYRTIVVSDACTADSDEAHARSLDVIQKWFGETLTADEVLSSLG